MLLFQFFKSRSKTEPSKRKQKKGLIMKLHKAQIGKQDKTITKLKHSIKLHSVNIIWCQSYLLSFVPIICRSPIRSSSDFVGRMLRSTSSIFCGRCKRNRERLSRRRMFASRSPKSTKTTSRNTNFIMWGTQQFNG